MSFFVQKISLIQIAGIGDSNFRLKQHFCKFLLHLYRQAGVERFLMGMENTDEATLKKIRKGGATQKDREAIRLLRQHGILSLATWVTDFAEITDRDFRRSLQQLYQVRLNS